MITFKNDDEKHAWDLYVAGALEAEGITRQQVRDLADWCLERRREREPIAGHLDCAECVRTGESHNSSHVDFTRRPRPSSGKSGGDGGS